VEAHSWENHWTKSWMFQQTTFDYGSVRWKTQILFGCITG
jgi:hypothetical protein